MQKVKKFFGIEGPYKFERMDISALCTVLNLIAIIAWNKGPFVGIPVNIIGMGIDIKNGTHINNMIMRLSLIIMNIYFLTL